MDIFLFITCGAFHTCAILIKTSRSGLVTENPMWVSHTHWNLNLVLMVHQSQLKENPHVKHRLFHVIEDFVHVEWSSGWKVSAVQQAEDCEWSQTVVLVCLSPGAERRALACRRWDLLRATWKNFKSTVLKAAERKPEDREEEEEGRNVMRAKHQHLYSKSRCHLLPFDPLCVSLSQPDVTKWAASFPRQSQYLWAETLTLLNSVWNCSRAETQTHRITHPCHM